MSYYLVFNEFYSKACCSFTPKATDCNTYTTMCCSIKTHLLVKIKKVCLFDDKISNNFIFLSKLLGTEKIIVLLDEIDSASLR